MDPERNGPAAERIDAGNATVELRVVSTDEEVVIAREVLARL